MTSPSLLTRVAEVAGAALSFHTRFSEKLHYVLCCQLSGVAVDLEEILLLCFSVSIQVSVPLLCDIHFCNNNLLPAVHWAMIFARSHPMPHGRYRRLKGPQEHSWRPDIWTYLCERHTQPHTQPYWYCSVSGGSEACVRALMSLSGGVAGGVAVRLAVDSEQIVLLYLPIPLCCNTVVRHNWRRRMVRVHRGHAWNTRTPPGIMSTADHTITCSSSRWIPIDIVFARTPSR